MGGSQYITMRMGGSTTLKEMVVDLFLRRPLLSPVNSVHPISNLPFFRKGSRESDKMAAEEDTSSQSSSWGLGLKQHLSHYWMWSGGRRMGVVPHP